ncbi:MAG: hypothetical protein ACLP01_31275 [Solirubrobacteraceae bacterium]
MDGACDEFDGVSTRGSRLLAVDGAREEFRHTHLLVDTSTGHHPPPAARMPERWAP